MFKLLKYAFIGAFILLACYHWYPRQTSKALTTGADKGYRAAKELAR